MIKVGPIVFEPYENQNIENIGLRVCLGELVCIVSSSEINSPSLAFNELILLCLVLCISYELINSTNMSEQHTLCQALC